MIPMPRQMPAEFEPHQSTLMCWPSRDDIWDGQIAEAERAYAELANTIAAYEPVTMIVDPKHIERAESLCGTGVTITSVPIDDSWCRDSGPIYVREPDGGLVGLDFVFNGWGQKFVPHDQDAQLAPRVQRECLKRGLILELGGRQGSVVRFLPPLVITASEIDQVAAIFGNAVAAATAGG